MLNNIYIPCSVHEIILLPDDGIFGAKDLEKMLCEINETMLEEEDVLSNQVYYFSREKGKVEETINTESEKIESGKQNKN